MGIVGAEKRDQLIREGEYLYSLVEAEHIEYARHTVHTVTGTEVPWTVAEEVCIVLALFARKKGIMEGVNNV